MYHCVARVFWLLLLCKLYACLYCFPCVTLVKLNCICRSYANKILESWILYSLCPVDNQWPSVHVVPLHPTSDNIFPGPTSYVSLMPLRYHPNMNFHMVTLIQGMLQIALVDTRKGSLYTLIHSYPHSWWRHQMKPFSASLALCAGNSPVTGEFPAQRPVTRSFDVFFDLHLNKRLSKQW